MKRILGKTRSKLRSKKGETLVGILVAILIIALSAGLFATMYTASMNIDLSAQKQDKAFYEAVGALEKMEKSDNTITKQKGKLQYTSSSGATSPPVDVEYLTKDGLTVYHDGDSGTGSGSEESGGGTGSGSESGGGTGSNGEESDG